MSVKKVARIRVANESEYRIQMLGLTCDEVEFVGRKITILR